MNDCQSDRQTLGRKVSGGWNVTNTSERKCCRCLTVGDYKLSMRNTIDPTHMYVIEHVRIEISKSTLSRLRDSMVDTMRATALL